MKLSRCAIVALFSAIIVAPAQATSQRTFVSTQGIDNPTCSLVAPCRTFAAAIAATDAGGEVIVLDSGGYGPVTISQSVSIVAPPGVYAGVSVFSGTGINVAGPDVVVTLRGLTLTGLGGNLGILFTQGTLLVVEDCAISNFAGGISVGGSVKAVIARTRVQRSAVGIGAGNGAAVTVAHSIVEGATFAGVQATNSAPGVTTRLLVTDTVLANGRIGIFGSGGNGAGPVRISAERNQVLGTAVAPPSSYGIVAEGPGCPDNECVRIVATDNVVTAVFNQGIIALPGTTVVASGNRVTESGYGLYGSGGALWTLGNNTVEKNEVDISGTILKSLR